MGMYAYPFGVDSPREVEIKLSGYTAEWLHEAARICQCNWIKDGTLLATREVVEQAVLQGVRSLKHGVADITGNEYQYLLKISVAARNMAILIEWLNDSSNRELFFG